MRALKQRSILLFPMFILFTHSKTVLLSLCFSAPAPVHISSFLSRHYRIEITKNKEHTAELETATGFCESVAKDLISISCAEDSEAVLNSIDGKNVAFLDFLIDCELKQCVSHSLVQQYVSQIWFGDLKLEEWKLMLLFLIALLCPPIWLYLSLPFKNRHRQIPVIKFICKLISHLYLILLLCLTVVVPWKYCGSALAPHWYEYFLFIWIIGMLVSEVSSERERSGLGWFPTIVVVLVLFAELLRIIAVGFDGSRRLDIVFARNQFLGAALMLSVLQLLDFLSIHRLFGPWGVIIGHLVVDVLRFLFILLIFFSSFTLQLLAVLKVSCFFICSVFCRSIYFKQSTYFVLVKCTREVSFTEIINEIFLPSFVPSFLSAFSLSLSLSLSLSPEEKSGTFVTFVSLDDSYA